MSDTLSVLAALYLLIAPYYLAACLLLLVTIGTGYAIVHIVKRLRPALVAYVGFLRWAFGTKEARRRRTITYLWFVAFIVTYAVDILDTSTSGFPRSGNWLNVFMFSVATIAVFLDHRKYFWKHSSKPA